MRYLADTHVLLAVCNERVDTLGVAISAVLRDRENAVYTSVASLWEIAIKYRIGKLPLKVSLHSLPMVIDDIGFGTIAVTANHALAVIDPLPETRDPFDRLLLAVCHIEDLRLLTVDRALVDHPLAAKL